MINHIRKNFVLILSIILIFSLAGLSGYFYISYNQKLNNLEKENEELNQKYLKTKNDLSKATESLKLKDTQIEEQNKEIENLKQTTNNTVINPEEITTNTDQNSDSIYNRINGSDEFKNQIIDALRLMQTGDNEHFQIVESQVTTINYFDNYGGYQENRDIYIGSNGYNIAIIASVISHEAQHVYNVYVDGIYGYHTKAQELPCYQAELITAQRLGAPTYFITSVENQIAYWESQ